MGEHCAIHRLKPNGVFVTQSGAADPVPAEYYVKEGGDQSSSNCYAPIKNTLKAVFDCVVPYSTNIPSLVEIGGTIWLSKILVKKKTMKQLKMNGKLSQRQRST